MSFRPTVSPAEASTVAVAAWRIAGKEARAAGKNAIGVPELLIGIFSLGKLQSGTFEGADQSEFEAVMAFLNTCCADVAAVRKSLRGTLAGSEDGHPAGREPRDQKIRRSSAVKEIFRLGTDDGQRTATVFHLLRAILESGPDWLDAHLAVAKEDMFARLKTECEARDAICALQAEPGSLALSIDASAVTDPPSAANEFFTRLTYNIPEYVASDEYSEISKHLLEVFPKAESAAVIVVNDQGDLLLKSGCPARDLKLSLRVVRQVMESKHAQVWMREDSTQSMLRSAGETSCAMYAPILSGDMGIGAVYVGTSEQAREFDERELKQASAIARHLGTCFENQRLRRSLEQQNRVLQRLLTNFSPSVREKLLEMAGRGQLRLGGVRSEVSVLCSDIRGFTKLSSKLDAEDVVELLNDYFSVTVQCIFDCAGTIDKFVGDAILAVFGSPVPDANHRIHAAEAALAMQRAIVDLNLKREARGLPVCNMGIGIHCGEVLHGFIGSRDRMEYTVIGDTVNIASRLCDGAGPCQIVISQALHEHIWRAACCEQCEIPTKHEGLLRAYRLLPNMQAG